MSDLVTCTRCNGCGTVELGAEHQKTLDYVRAELEANALDIAEHFDIEPTAANNRLETLRRLGFLTRRRVRRQWVYSLKAVQA